MKKNAIIIVLLLATILAGPKRLEGLGYVLRYWAGALPAWLLQSESDPRFFFLADEIPLQYRSEVQQLQDRTLRHLKAAVSELGKIGVPTVIVPVPTKLAFFRDKLPAELPSYEIWKPDHLSAEEKERGESPDFVYENILAAGRTAAERTSNVQLINLNKAFRAHQNQYPLFHLADSHWTEFGISLAVDEIVRVLRESKIKVLPYRFENSEAKVPRYDHDLLKTLQLPEWFLKRKAEFQSKDPYAALKVAPNSDPLYGRIVTVGTSNCDHATRGKESTFPAWLARITHRELYRVCYADVVFSGWIPEMVRRKFHFQKNDVLVWEFPVRNVPGGSAEAEIRQIPLLR